MGYGGVTVMRLGIGVLFISAAFVSMGVEELDRAKLASDDPRELALADLENEPPGLRGLVLLSDFLACEEGVFSENSQNGIKKVIVPLYPSHLDEPPAPEQLQTLLRIFSVRDEEHLAELFDREFLECQILTCGSALDAETKRHLTEGYPGIDVDGCRILDLNASAPNASFAARMIAFGVFLGVSGLIIVVGKIWMALDLGPAGAAGDFASPSSSASPRSIVPCQGHKAF